MNDNTNQKLTLTFFMNDNDVPVADLHLGERRLLATTHPATIVAAIYAMGLKQLTVVTSKGHHTGLIRFNEPGDEVWPLASFNLHLKLNPELYQYRDLAPTDAYAPLLEGLTLFAHEQWDAPSATADEHLRAAHHHLPADLIKRPLSTRDPEGWEETLERRNGWIYFPEC